MKKSNKFIPKKSLGQNFLINKGIQQKIVNACNLSKEDVVLEIGPGKGALTQWIAPQVSKVIAIEKDYQLCDSLEKKYKGTNVSVVHADFLRFDFDCLPDRLKVISNLPYNIATPIIEKILLHHKNIESLYITVQIEHGKRMASRPNTKDYGSLSCFVQFYAIPQILFKINNSAFRPIPKVQSCFMRLEIQKNPAFRVQDEELLFQIIRAGFSQRRKTIQNSLSSLLGKEQTRKVLKSLGLHPNLRAENISLQEYVCLSNVVATTDLYEI